MSFTSARELFTIGIGPSSSHTVGPMRAAMMFRLLAGQFGDAVASIRVELFGSLAATGAGHGTDGAVVLGLLGEDPETIDPARAAIRLDEVKTSGFLGLQGERRIEFEPSRDILFRTGRSHLKHPNTLVFTAENAHGQTLGQRTYFSVGGGFVVDESSRSSPKSTDAADMPYPFNSAAELLMRCAESGLSVAQVVRANELSQAAEAALDEHLERVWHVMSECIRNGVSSTQRTLPGGLRVRRRAPRMYRILKSKDASGDPLHAMDWVNLYALAVNEENAAGGRVVTAPTNGAAGVVPAVLSYYRNFVPGASEEGISRFLLAAAAVGTLFRRNASISGAEVGCQGEIGSACSMAAAGLAEVLGGTPEQVENAAEIALEHNLGLTCDPVAGLVQIPCIERNALASVKAINSARMALNGDGSHLVTLDQAIETMRQTGADMKTKYKETSLGGLAVNVTEC